MATKQTTTVDLTSVPFFNGTKQLAPREAADDVWTVFPDYRFDRLPAPQEPGQHFGGGLGLAAVMDVKAHPVRARSRRIDILTVFAITVVAAVGAVMMVMVGALRP